jgi:hypothetical protein
MPKRGWQNENFKASQSWKIGKIMKSATNA